MLCDLCLGLSLNPETPLQDQPAPPPWLAASERAIQGGSPSHPSSWGPSSGSLGPQAPPFAQPLSCAAPRGSPRPVPGPADGGGGGSPDSAPLRAAISGAAEALLPPPGGAPAIPQLHPRPLQGSCRRDALPHHLLPEDEAPWPAAPGPTNRHVGAPPRHVQPEDLAPWSPALGPAAPAPTTRVRSLTSAGPADPSLTGSVPANPSLTGSDGGGAAGPSVERPGHQRESSFSSYIGGQDDQGTGSIGVSPVEQVQAPPCQPPLLRAASAPSSSVSRCNSILKLISDVQSVQSESRHHA